MTDLNIAKQIIQDNYLKASQGIFSTRNNCGDRMETLYVSQTLQIDICHGWEYFEVFGLSDEEFDELFNFYCDL